MDNPILDIFIPLSYFILHTKGNESTSSISSFRKVASILGSTKKAWARVSAQYKADAKPNYKDIISGYVMMDPLTNTTVILLVSFVLIDLCIYEAYISIDQFYSLYMAITDNIIFILAILGFTAMLQLAYFVRKQNNVYLVDFKTYKGPDRLQITHDDFMHYTRACGEFSEESIAFQEKLLRRNGLGNKTYFPEAIFIADKIAKNNGDKSEVLNMEAARVEAEMVMFDVVERLLESNNLTAKDIDILIVNCSLFNPTPSLTSMIVNRFKMRHNVLTYNLSGMGCSAGLISIDLAKDLLQVHRNVNCIVLSTENITQNWYLGKVKSMLLTNTLFRMGGAAVLLSNKESEKHRARYALKHTVRTHIGADDGAYQSVYQIEDDMGITGVRLSKTIMDVSGAALKSNITTLAPLILPLPEQLRFFKNMIERKWLKNKDVKPYMPNFRRAIQHFCIHTGGRAVIDTLENVLSLSEYDCEPSRFALERFGNTSSASVWYELEYIEKSGRCKKGDKIWQIAFGSGFKCNSGVWQALKTIESSSLDY